MPEPRATRLSDIVWGGRIRPAYQWRIREIARGAAHTKTRSVHGTMVHSTESTTFRFLDGGLSEERGNFGPESGMRWFGKLAMAYLLYELGELPQELLGATDLPSKEQLRERVRLEAEAARASQGAERH
jgi:hypothetical protein